MMPADLFLKTFLVKQGFEKALRWKESMEALQEGGD